VALVGQVHGTRPATEAVTAENENLHRWTPAERALAPSGQATTGIQLRIEKVCWLLAVKFWQPRKN